MKLNTDKFLNKGLNRGLRIQIFTTIITFIIFFEIFLFEEIFGSEYYNLLYKYVLYKYTVYSSLLSFGIIILIAKKLNFRWLIKFSLIVSAIVIVPIIFRIFFNYITILWIYIILNVVILYLVSTNKSLKILYINLLVFFVLIASIEAIFQINKPEKDKSEIQFNELKNMKFTRLNDTFGYSPTEENEIHSIYKIDNDTIYNVIYKIDSLGRRNIPSSYKEFVSDTNVLLFGCSFTFGTGLNDTQTSSYYLKMFNNNFRVYNMGFDGYSPYQTLSYSLSPNLNGIENSDTSYTIIILNLINDHLYRIIGFERSIYFDEAFYEFDSTGKISFKGNISDKRDIIDILFHYIRKSLIFKPIVDKFYYNKATSDINLNRLIHTYNNIRSNLNIIFRNMRTIVIYWDENDELSGKIYNLLKENNFEVYQISEILPNYHSKKSEYHIRVDGHPNAHANRIIAKFILDFITE